MVPCILPDTLQNRVQSDGSNLVNIVGSIDSFSGCAAMRLRFRPGLCSRARARARTQVSSGHLTGLRMMLFTLKTEVILVLELRSNLTVVQVRLRALVATVLLAASASNHGSTPVNILQHVVAT